MIMIRAILCLLRMFLYISVVVSGRSMTQNRSLVCSLELMRTYEDFEYFQDGDIILGGIFTINYHMNRIKDPTNRTCIACFLPISHYYKNLLTFFFGIEKINENPHILQNISLGYHAFDSCGDEIKAIKSVLQILSGPGKIVPNYSCTKQHKIIGFVGDHYSKTTLPIAQLLSVYRYTQISYGATSHELNNRNLYPNFFRTVKNYSATFSILLKLIKLFGWTWVGILASDDDSGEKEVQELAKSMTHEGICAAFIIKIPLDLFKREEEIEKNLKNIRESSAQVIIICGSNSYSMGSFLNDLEEKLSNRTLILHPSWAVHKFFVNHYPKTFNGSLALDMIEIKLPELADFLKNITRGKYPNDLLLENIWMLNGCLTSKPEKNQDLGKYYGIKFRNCTGEEPLTSIPRFLQPGLFPRVYIAVSTMAVAIENLFSGFQSTNRKAVPMYAIKQHLSHSLKNLIYIDQTNLQKYYDKDNEIIARYYVENWILLDEVRLDIRCIGHFNPWVSAEDDRMVVNVNRVVWKYNGLQIPKSQCSETCLPGSQKVTKPGIDQCCYNCAPCSAGEISNISDSENCNKCPEYEWPNQKKDLCIPRLEEFLSFENEAITVVIISISILFHVKTILVITVFILFSHTPTVKANNKSLSFVLLFSIMLNFLCVFLFLGRPVDLTCQLRHMSVSVLFSVAKSSILAKNIVVCIAFKATKPDSGWKKLIGIKLPYYIVFICSSVQIIICLAWLILSPPYLELDTHSSQGKIIVQCNEGSVIGFYSVLGYMGILAAVSFILAFLARTLPDRFNEAKYITFSMLVFCSVWIAMIPAYLSTKGKYTVAVEIFAILASNAGLLGCIFFPKCYIILYKPKLNTNICLLDKRSI